MVSDFLSSLLLVFKRFFLLIFTPYKTMRKIAMEKDYFQIFIIFGLVLIYFLGANLFRGFRYAPILMFSFFLLNFFITVLFFTFVSSFFVSERPTRSLIFTLSYSLAPTLIWFISNSWFYYIIPPPRTISIPGMFFSIFFIAFSVSLLLWKIILFYLAIRFSTKLHFFRIVYFLVLYMCFFIAYSVGLYYLRIFRIPFI